MPASQLINRTGNVACQVSPQTAPRRDSSMLRRALQRVLLGSQLTMGALLMTAAGGTADVVAQAPEHGTFLSGLNRLGRVVGFGYSDGYHATRPGPPSRLWALPPRQIWEEPTLAHGYGHHHAAAPSHDYQYGSPAWFQPTPHGSPTVMEMQSHHEPVPTYSEESSLLHMSPPPPQVNQPMMPAPVYQPPQPADMSGSIPPPVMAAPTLRSQDRQPQIDQVPTERPRGEVLPTPPPEPSPSDLPITAPSTSPNVPPQPSAGELLPGGRDPYANPQTDPLKAIGWKRPGIIREPQPNGYYHQGARPIPARRR
ncbi:hypothetical protein SH139x_002937 [Planctomycetaceae bacterium SH139]